MSNPDPAPVAVPTANGWQIEVDGKVLADGLSQKQAETIVRYYAKPPQEAQQQSAEEIAVRIWDAASMIEDDGEQSFEDRVKATITAKIRPLVERLSRAEEVLRECRRLVDWLGVTSGPAGAHEDLARRIQEVLAHD